jgi:predicted nucleic acid-binding protein
MAYLLDTGILLRFVDSRDSLHSSVVDAVAKLGDQQQTLVITMQNVAEFCNVLTRPITANGLGLAPNDAINFVKRDIEPICRVIFDHNTAYDELKRLISTYNVVGKQVHDAHLVALMLYSALRTPHSAIASIPPARFRSSACPRRSRALGPRTFPSRGRS